MAINFGQQINQALSGAIDRNQRGRVQAQRLAQQLQQQQFEQEIQQMVQGLREREFQLAQEAQTEQMYQNVIENRLAQKQEERLQQQADQQGEYYRGLIENQQNQGRDDGVNYSSLISGLQSLLNSTGSTLKSASSQRERFETENPLLDQGALSEPQRIREANEYILSAEERDDVDEGFWDFDGSVNRSQITDVQEQLAQARQDSARVADELLPAVSQEQQSREIMIDVQNSLRDLISQLRGEPNQTTAEVPEIANRSEFDNLEEGSVFITGGTKYRKENGQAVPIQ